MFCIWDVKKTKKNRDNHNRLNLSPQHRLSSLKLKYFWKMQFGPNNLSIKAQAMSDYITWMCSTSAKCNKFL